VLGKSLFKSNFLQLGLFVTIIKGILVYLLQKLNSSNMQQLQLLFKSKKITSVIHILSCQVSAKFIILWQQKDNSTEFKQFNKFAIGRSNSEVN